MACLDADFLKRLKKPKDHGDKLPLTINKEMKEMGIDPDLCDIVHTIYLKIITDKGSSFSENVLYPLIYTKRE